MELRLLKLQLIYHNYSSKRLLIKIFFLATIMASIPCFDLIYPIDNYDTDNISWSFEKSNHRMNISELHSTFTNLLAGNWLNHHYKAALIVGKDSIKAVTVMRKLGFREAIGVDRKPCTSIVKKGSIYELPFKDNSFDFVFSMAMIDGVRVPARMVLEMERVLKPARVGVVLRRVSGSVPTRDVMKAAAPVASYLKFSNIVDVRTVNRTVMVIFKKRSIGIGDGDGRLNQVVLMPEEKADTTLLLATTLPDALLICEISLVPQCHGQIDGIYSSLDNAQSIRGWLESLAKCYYIKVGNNLVEDGAIFKYMVMT